MNLKKFVLLTSFILAMAMLIGVVSYIITDEIINANEVTKLQKSSYICNDLSDASVIGISNISNDESKENKEQSVERENSNYISPIDFDYLKKSNPDIFAWINIPGTAVDYPVVQHPTDDSYYLKHGPEGMYSAYGCPYIELSDSGSFLEFNTVIYGHNMNDGSMFASLHDFENKDFFEKHREIVIYTTEHMFTYEVFAAVMYSDAHIPYYFNDAIESDRTSFLNSLVYDSIPERSIISDDATVSEDNCIITLSTCDKKLRDNRFLVVAVLKQIDGREA